MKRLGYLAVLMVLSSSASTAQAGDAYSFLIGGHRIHIEARRGCRSLSCLSWSDAGKRNRRDRDDDVGPAKPTLTTTSKPQPARAEAELQLAPAVVQAPPAPVQQQGEPVQKAQLQPAPTPQIETPQVQIAPQAQVTPSPPAPAPAPVVTAPSAPKVASETVVTVPSAPKAMEPTSTTTQSVAPTAPKTELKTEAKIVMFEKPAVVTEPAPPPAPAKLKDEKETAGTPLGDWQTEGNKGLVRIEQCGKSLCGYVLNASTNTKGETVLANMKSKSDSKWIGDIYSRASGNGYYAKMTLKAPNTLHVEACAVLRFFCTGNDWTRIVTTPDEVVISRQSTSQPNS
jgi:uncharacterized protein (DUF2147 family)